MRHSRPLRNVSLLALLLASGTIVSAQKEPARKALLIGNSHYKWLGTLRTPLSDVQAVAQVLHRDIGFETVIVEDAGLEKIEAAVAEFAKSIQPGDVAMFYYAGYGLQVDRENYLAPVAFSSAQDVDRDAYSAKRILNALRKRDPSRLFFLLDASWDNAELRRRFPDSGLARMVPEASNVLVGISAADGEKNADVADSPISAFAKGLVAVLPKRGLTITEIVRQVTVAVEDATGGKQSPYAIRNNLGDVVLNPKAADEAAWDALRSPPDADALAKFLATFPSSLHAKEALALIEKIEWDKAREGAAVALRSYLARFPNGKYAVDAQQRLAQIEQSMTNRLAMETIARYKTAFEGKNIEELKAIWPSLPKPDAFKESFKNMREISVEPESAESLKIIGDKISARCKRTIRYFGVSQPEVVFANLSLRRTGNLVIIESISYTR